MLLLTYARALDQDGMRGGSSWIGTPPFIKGFKKRPFLENRMVREALPARKVSYRGGGGVGGLPPGRPTTYPTLLQLTVVTQHAQCICSPILRCLTAILN